MSDLSIPLYLFAHLFKDHSYKVAILSLAFCGLNILFSHFSQKISFICILITLWRSYNCILDAIRSYFHSLNCSEHWISFIALRMRTTVDLVKVHFYCWLIIITVPCVSVWGHLMNWLTCLLGRCGVCQQNVNEPSLRGPGTESGADVQNQKAKIAPTTHNMGRSHTFSGILVDVGPIRSHESDQLKGVWEESINIASYVIYHANNGCHFLSFSCSFSISVFLNY